MTQDISQFRKDHTVMVDGGSGVLIQPMTNEYSYVYTAKHNLLVDSEVQNSDLKSVGDIKITCFDDTELTILALIPNSNPSIDIAIILVEYYPNICVSKIDTPLTLQNKIMLTGYPDSRRGNSKTMEQQYNSYVLSFHDNNIGMLVLSNDNVVDRGGIIGFSGGGLFFIDQEKNEAYLCGIETGMDGNIDVELHGRILGVPVNAFDDLISDSTYSGNSLARVVPIHLTSFEYLKEHIFEISDWIDGNQSLFIQDCLKKIAIDVDLKPIDIFDELSEYLEAINDKNKLNGTELWSSFLELLVISILIDCPSEVNFEYVKNLFKCRRLIYINSDKSWKRSVSEIFSLSHRDMKDDGIYIIRTNKFSNYAMCNSLELKYIIENIAYTGDRHSIANSQINNSANRSLVDIKALHNECIEKKENDYKTFNMSNVDDLNKKLVAEYSVYITNKVI